VPLQRFGVVADRSFENRCRRRPSRAVREGVAAELVSAIECAAEIVEAKRSPQGEARPGDAQ